MAIFVMVEQKKSIADIIEEMRRELRDDPTNSDADLFAPYMAKKKKSRQGAKKSRVRPKKAKPKKLKPKKPGKKKKKR